MTTGGRIKEARKYRNLTQKELAAKLGISYQALAQWENDLRNPKQETLKKIGNALKIDWTYFTDWEVRPDTVSAADGSYAEIEHQWEIVNNKISERAANINRLASTLKMHLISFTEEDFSSVESLVLLFLTKLNDTGQQEALKRIQELTEIPRYQRTKAGEDPDA